jgi:hypothetical protein
MMGASSGVPGCPDGPYSLRTDSSQKENLMIKSLLAAAALAGAFMLAPAGVERAHAVGPVAGAIAKPDSSVQEARYRGRGAVRVHRGVRFHRAVPHRRVVVHRWHRPYRYRRPYVGLYVGAPVVAYGAYSYGHRYSGCGWLKAKWHATGRRYWWRRYVACRGY